MNIAEEGEREKDNAERQRTLRSAEIAIGKTVPCVLLAEKPGARAEIDLIQRAQRSEHRGHGGGWAYLRECEAYLTWRGGLATVVLLSFGDFVALCDRITNLRATRADESHCGG
jgi:hypothetical protein